MDISLLREREIRSELTVSELNAYVKRMFDSDRSLSALSVTGEISNLTIHRTGHLYFSLKDEESQIRAVMFRSSAASLKFVPENGMKVTVRCSVSVYTATGSYQLYVNTMQPDGIGSLYLAYEQLKSKLEKEGLFSEHYKKNLPPFPKSIGVITSPTGAAVRDIINVTGRRYPSAKVYIYPSLVQGEGAEENLIEALEYFENSKLVDVIIIGRGGGSIEDLWAFNGEKLARKIFECQTPIISAVGHETDFTICDFVADMRAPTPSAAAELAVPDYRELTLRIGDMHERMHRALTESVRRYEERLENIKSNSVLSDVSLLFENREKRLQEFGLNLKKLVEDKFNALQNSLAVASGKANALSPLATLARGYSVAFGKDKKIIRSVNDVSCGDKISIRLSDGNVVATVDKED
ncbi:MAG: exodeoxyribonuclease VII large subunit [Ruminococcaceae bacterium]|nr:exodeoxyribonuclease VII large subunit [Oscillospiraceae bacterium]